MKHLIPFDLRHSALAAILLSVPSVASTSLAQSVVDSATLVACTAQRGAPRTRSEVFAAFRCRGDRAAVAIRALDITNTSADVQSAIQENTSEHLTTATLEKAKRQAMSAPTAMRRFVGLNVIANAVKPSMALSPVDTLTPDDWDPRVTAHGTSKTSAELKAQGMQMLRALADSAPADDVRRRSQRLLKIFSIRSPK